MSRDEAGCELRLATRSDAECRRYPRPHLLEFIHTFFITTRARRGLRRRLRCTNEFDGAKIALVFVTLFVVSPVSDDSFLASPLLFWVLFFQVRWFIVVIG